MNSVTARAPAKINLSLGVGPLRDDGYHSLATVYLAVDLYDEVRATAVEGSDISVAVHVDADSSAEVADVPEDKRNLAVRAALVLREVVGIQRGAALTIRKVIPVAGGMAGGSADAAAALVACNQLWGFGFRRDQLEAIGGALGSDVPFCLRGGLALGSGHGEEVSPVLARGSYHWVFAIAETGLSTADVYAEFDRLNADRDIPEPEVADELMTALRSGDAEALGEALSNDLTEAALSLRPELDDTLAVGRECGALGAQISGSGPTTMFLARDEQHAMDIAVALASSQVCADVTRAYGPVPGARVL